MDPIDLLNELLSLPEDERIRHIAEDVRSKLDRYRPIDPFQLAEALGIDDAESPSGDWTFTCSAEILPLEEWVIVRSPLSEFPYRIEDKVDPDRLEQLIELFEAMEDQKERNFDFLTAKERKLIELSFAQEDLELNEENGIGTVAHRTVGEGDDSLRFEASIEDDGSCLELLGPYDFRDGLFSDFSNSVTEEG